MLIKIIVPVTHIVHCVVVCVNRVAVLVAHVKPQLSETIIMPVFLGIKPQEPALLDRGLHALNTDLYTFGISGDFVPVVVGVPCVQPVEL